MGIFEIITQYREGIWAGLSVTLQLSVTVWAVGLLLGSALGAAGNNWKISIGIPVQIGSFILAGVPVLVLLFWLHYPLQSVLGVVIDPFYTSAATLCVVNTFAVSDVVRRTLNDFPQEYLMAARVYGLRERVILMRIQLPIILRQIVPGLLLIQVIMLQATIFASLISVDEIFRVAQRINAQIYQPVEVYTTLGIFFLAVCLPLNGIALWMRAKFTRDLSER